MKNTRKTNLFFKFLVAVVLVAVVALSVFSCAKENHADNGEITLTIEVVNKAGNSVEHEIKTTAGNLADALTGSGIAAGDDGEYGLYITTVDGEIADYSVDGSYWSISKDGEVLFTGASSTPIADGEHYELTYTVSN